MNFSTSTTKTKSPWFRFLLNHSMTFSGSKETQNHHWFPSNHSGQPHMKRSIVHCSLNTFYTRWQFLHVSTTSCYHGYDALSMRLSRSSSPVGSGIDKSLMILPSSALLSLWNRNVRKEFMKCTVYLDMFLPRNLKEGFGSLLADLCVNTMGRRLYCPLHMEVSYCTFGFGASFGTICVHYWE